MILVAVYLLSLHIPRKKAAFMKGTSIWFFPSFQVFNFELTPEDMKAIDGLNKNFRYGTLKL
jgi:hypothetical protein